ncbi:uncharacterized protein LOC143848017 [Tasmannia lanceolata]|uniref:uncharacterized protein LOC143848017 n=1 Tax=Tasmannia lanceolata TaxID=3420 RepID=UPI004062CBDF
MGSYNNTPLDSLFLQNFMDRLQLKPPYLNTNSFLSQSLEDFLQVEEEDEGEKTQFAKEELKLEKEIVRIILSGKTETLKPNSGQSVAIGEHHVCVGFHEETSSDHRVWEWHGHIILFDEEDGYTPEYIYGNYFERIQVKFSCNGDDGNDEEKEKEINGGNLGLRGLIGDGDSLNGRILRRNLNAGSPL